MALGLQGGSVVACTRILLTKRASPPRVLKMTILTKSLIPAVSSVVHNDMVVLVAGWFIAHGPPELVAGNTGHGLAGAAGYTRARGHAGRGHAQLARTAPPHQAHLLHASSLGLSELVRCCSTVVTTLRMQL